MMRFVHDQFAKHYLEELLTPLGKVETSAAYWGEAVVENFGQGDNSAAGNWGIDGTTKGAAVTI